MSKASPIDAPSEAAARRMKGKVCLVTGGGSGIGRAAARKMAEEGATAVVIAGRREAEIESAAAECRALGAQALAIRADVTQEDDVERVVRTTGRALWQAGRRADQCRFPGAARADRATAKRRV